MRKIFMILIALGLSTNLFSQSYLDDPAEKRTSVTIGIFEGGGSLIGADMEFLLTKRLGFQLGAGLIGFGGGLNYHFKPTIRSSFVSLQYWNQGVGDIFIDNLIGPCYVFRGKRWFTFQIGLAATLSEGPAWPSSMDFPPVMLTYAIGAYLPF